MSNSLPWDEVEKQIQHEVDWLRSKVDTFLDKEKNLPPNTCKNCLLRQIAILIVSGEVQAREIKKDPALPSFWAATSIKPTIPIHHGGEWHSQIMEDVENHFLAQNYTVVREPTLHRGRADLGVYKKNELDLLIEIGTISYFKLGLNLRAMHKFTYLIMPNNDILLEFTKWS